MSLAHLSLSLSLSLSPQFLSPHSLFQTLLPKMASLNGTTTAAAAIPKPLITPSEIQSEFSHHDPTIARINNGSFGCCPASIIAAQQRHQLLFLRQPDAFYFNSLKPSILQTRVVIQNLINADHVDEVSIVDNATTAAAAVLQHTARAFPSSAFQPGDAVLLLHYAYGAVKKSVEAINNGTRSPVQGGPCPSVSK